MKTRTEPRPARGRASEPVYRVGALAQGQRALVQRVARRRAQLGSDRDGLLERQLAQQHGQQTVEARPRSASLDSRGGIACSTSTNSPRCTVLVGGQPCRQVGAWQRDHGFELLRQLPAQRDPARRAGIRPASRRSASMRCGASKSTCALGVPAACASVGRPFAVRAAANPLKTKRSAPRSPATLSAASAALAPGTGTTRWPAACAAATSTAPGSEIAGRPGIADVGDAFAARQAAEHGLRRLTLVVLVHREQRLVDAPDDAAARRSRACLRRRPHRRVASTWIARSVMSARLPIGVATTYSAPAGYCWSPAARAAACNNNEASMVTREAGRRSRKSAGDDGESRALAHLQREGLSLVQRNYRVARGPHARAGEVDLILRERDGTLVFVEVRVRGDGRPWRRRRERRRTQATAHRLRGPALPAATGRRCRRAASMWWPSTATACSG